MATLQVRVDVIEMRREFDLELIRTRSQFIKKCVSEFFRTCTNRLFRISYIISNMHVEKPVDELVHY